MLNKSVCFQWSTASLEQLSDETSPTHSLESPAGDYFKHSYTCLFLHQGESYTCLFLQQGESYTCLFLHQGELYTSFHEESSSILPKAKYGEMNDNVIRNCIEEIECHMKDPFNFSPYSLPGP